MEKKKFTYAILAYNQEQYVIEQMESIKYQIKKYGENYINYFLLCDDASKDNTVGIVKKWLETEKIFDKTEIIVAKENQGLVANYITALKSIKTDKFKLLGGDDLYYKNNIYEAANKSDLVITPVLRLKGFKVSGKTRWTNKRYVFKRNNVKKVMKKDFKFLYPLETPGIFCSHTFMEEPLYEELSQYKWCEDLPCWNYLIHLESIKIEILEKPYVLYRINCGISTNEGHVHNKDFLIEDEKIHKKILTDCYKYPDFINPYRYLYRIRSIFYGHILCNLSKRLCQFDRNLQNEAKTAEIYYSEIHDIAESWIQKNWNEMHH